MPFLLNHDSGTQIGLIEDVRVEGGRIRGMARMGNHPDASWVEQDIRAGIRRKVSVGYKTGEDFISRKLDNGLTERKYTKWMPMEGSSVSVPADYDVGVGRSLRQNIPEGVPKGNPELDMCPDCQTILDGASVCPTCGWEDPGEPANGNETPRNLHRPTGRERKMAEKETAPEIRAGESEAQERAAQMAGMAQMSGRLADLPKWLIENRSVEDVRKEVLKDMEAKAIREATSTTPGGNVDLTPREMKEFSLTRAIGFAASGKWDGLEREVNEATAKGAGKNYEANHVYLPMNLRTAVAGNVVATSSLGGAGVQTTVLSLIELLRNRMMVRKLGATVLPGLTSSITFPRQITANTFTWTGENPSTAQGLTSLTLDNVALSPKTAMSASAYSKQIIVQSTPAIDALVSNDIMQVIALGIDLAALSGTGANNQPKGVASQTGVIAITMGAAGAIPTFANIVNYETQVATNNADFGSFAFLTTPGVKGVLKGTLKNTVGTAGYIWPDSNELNGYPAFVSNQVRSNLTKSTSTTICHEIFFGDWSQLLIGEFGGSVDLLVDPYFYADQGMIRLVASVMVDCNVRLPKAFAYTADALIA